MEETSDTLMGLPHQQRSGIPIAVRRIHTAFAMLDNEFQELSTPRAGTLLDKPQGSRVHGRVYAKCLIC